MRIILIFLLLNLCLQLNGQKEDHVWLFGFSGPPTDGGPSIDFNDNPPELINDSLRYWDFISSNTSICDKNGKLKMYSNGMVLLNNNNEYILNGGDSISFDQLWENSYVEEYNWAQGKPIIDLILIVPRPLNSKQFYVLYEQTERDNVLQTNYLYYSLVDFLNPNENGIIIKKKKILTHSLSNGMLKLCQHSNGRDWWVIKPSKDLNRYFTFLLNPDNIELYLTQEFSLNLEHGLGQSNFSQDGSHFVIHQTSLLGQNSKSDLVLFDFNRCTGELSNYQIDQSITTLRTFRLGVEFSSNGSLIYASNGEELFQFDITNGILSNKKLIAQGNVNHSPDRQSISYMKLGPDHKIYVSNYSGGGNNEMSIINHPNKIGKDCEFKQNALILPGNYAATMPNIPNFRLGPIDGSECDTLGIDNNPISKFRYVQDSMDHLQLEFVDLSYFRPEEWSWDFGDSNSSDEQNPTHTYGSNGVYEVCLTVSNENSSNTSCRSLQVGTSSTTPLEDTYDIQLFPNPVTEVLLVNVTDYLPEDAVFRLYGLEGQLLYKSKINYGWNSLDVSHLSNGVLIYEISERKRVIQVGKLIKD